MATEKKAMIPISQDNDSEPLWNKELLSHNLHFASSVVNGNPVSMLPRHRPIRSVHARSTSTNQIHEGTGISESGDSEAQSDTRAHTYTDTITYCNKIEYII